MNKRKCPFYDYVYRDKFGEKLFSRSTKISILLDERPTDNKPLSGVQ